MRWQEQLPIHYLPRDSCGRYNQVRTADDIVRQLLTLYLASVVAYCHLLWIRGESIRDWRPLFFVFSPLTVVVQHVLALLTILFRYIKSKIKPEPEPFDVRIPLRWLFGRVPPATDAHTGPISLPEKEPSPNVPSPSTNDYSNILRSAKAIGSVVQFASLAAYLAFCVITATLFLRRYSKNPSFLTNIDYLLFHLSLGGILLTLLTLPLTPFTPNLALFTATVPLTMPRRTALDRAILSFRDSSAPQLFSPRYSPALFTYLQEHKQVAYLEAIAAVLAAARIGTTPTIPIRDILDAYDSYGEIPTLVDGWQWPEAGGHVVMALVMFHSVRNAVQGKKLWEKTRLQDQEELLNPSVEEKDGDSNEEVAEGWTQWVWAKVMAFVNDPLAYTPDISNFLSFTVLLFFTEHMLGKVTPELEDFAIWPVDMPCPQQWRDPLVREWEWMWKWWGGDFWATGH